MGAVNFSWVNFIRNSTYYIFLYIEIFNIFFADLCQLWLIKSKIISILKLNRFLSMIICIWLFYGYNNFLKSLPNGYIQSRGKIPLFNSLMVAKLEEGDGNRRVSVKSEEKITSSFLSLYMLNQFKVSMTFRKRIKKLYRLDFAII